VVSTVKHRGKSEGALKVDLLPVIRGNDGGIFFV